MILHFDTHDVVFLVDLNLIDAGGLKLAFGSYNQGIYHIPMTNISKPASVSGRYLRLQCLQLKFSSLRLVLTSLAAADSQQKVDSHINLQARSPSSNSSPTARHPQLAYVHLSY